MTTQVKIDVRDNRIESGIAYAPFCEALDNLASAGLELITLPQNAALRINRGKDVRVSRTGNWVKEGVVYVPNGRSRLVRVSPIVANAKEATLAHKSGKEFYLKPSQIEEAIADSVGWPTKYVEIPTNRFDSDALTVFAFGGSNGARTYGEFLKSSKINELSVWTLDQSNILSDKPFAMQFWFGGLDENGISGFDGSNCDLHASVATRGVRYE